MILFDAMKIYTRTGDSGTTSLFGGERASKHSIRVKSIGYIDELNALLGTVLAESPDKNVTGLLVRIQGELFVLGADLATPNTAKTKVTRIKKPFTTRFEKEIDRMDQELPKLKNFILPGGSSAGAKLHLARTIARRAERAIVTLADEEKINHAILPYINRLSDWLFVLARYVNKLEEKPEQIWKGRSKA